MIAVALRVYQYGFGRDGFGEHADSIRMLPKGGFSLDIERVRQTPATAILPLGTADDPLE
jgi:hypothetical protein